MEKAGEIMNTSAQFGPFVFVCVLCILLVATGAYLYARHVIIPARNADKENQAKMTDAVVALCQGMTATKAAVDANTAAVTKAGEAGSETNELMDKLIRSKSAEIEILQKLADKAGVDIDAELGLMRGALELGPARRQRKPTV